MPSSQLALRPDATLILPPAIAELGEDAYLKNGGQLEQAQFMAAHASPRTTKLYDRRAQEASLDEVERIIL